MKSKLSVILVLIVIATIGISAACAAPANPEKPMWELSVGKYWTTDNTLSDGWQGNVMYRWGDGWFGQVMHADGMDASDSWSCHHKDYKLDVNGKFDMAVAGHEWDKGRLTVGVGLGVARSVVDTKLKITGCHDTWSKSCSSTKWNPAGLVGAGYQLSDRWSASVAYVDPSLFRDTQASKMRGVTAAIGYAF